MPFARTELAWALDSSPDRHLHYACIARCSVTAFYIVTSYKEACKLAQTFYKFFIMSTSSQSYGGLDKLWQGFYNNIKIKKGGRMTKHRLTKKEQWLVNYLRALLEVSKIVKEGK